MSFNDEEISFKDFVIFMICFFLAVGTGIYFANTYYGESYQNDRYQNILSNNEQQFVKCSDYKTESVKEECFKDSFYDINYVGELYLFNISSHEEFQEWNSYESEKIMKYKTKNMNGLITILVTVISFFVYLLTIYFSFHVISKKIEIKWN